MKLNLLYFLAIKLFFKKVKIKYKVLFKYFKINQLNIIFSNKFLEKYNSQK